MKRIALVLTALVIAVPAVAQESVGCDKFKWPLERERTLLKEAPAAKSGVEIALANAVKLAVVPTADMKFPVAPTRTPKQGGYAGVLHVSALSAPGTYRVTLSANAWIEVIQNGRPVKSGEFSGAQGCEGLRKSVKFTLAAKPFVIELVGITAPDIGIAVTPD